MNAMNTMMRLLFCSLLIFSSSADASAWWWNSNDSRQYRTEPLRNDDFLNNITNRLKLTLPTFKPPELNIRIPTFTQPDLTINLNTMKNPDIFVRDLGVDVFNYQIEDTRFNPNLKLFDHVKAKVQFEFGGQAAPGGVKMDLGQMKYDQASRTPVKFSRFYEDAAQNQFKMERFNQKSIPNPSYLTFVQYHERQAQTRRQSLDVERNSSTELPVPPTKELIEGFEEKWTLSVKNSDQTQKSETYDIHINGIETDTNLHRFISAYQGSIKNGSNEIFFKVSSPHETNGEMTSLTFELEGKGSPKAAVTWTPQPGVDGSEAFKLLRENLPIPILVGPRARFRLNEVDISESPIKITAEGTIAPKQVGDVKDLVNLIGQEQRGIKISFSAPSADSTKTGLSLMNGLRNMGYMLTGRWGEVKNLRQELIALQNQNPAKFVLAAGFKDPSFMGMKHLRSALENSKRIYVPQDQGEILGQADTKKSELSGYKTGFFNRAFEVLTLPVGVAFKATLEVVKTALSVVFGGEIKQEAINGYSPIINQSDAADLAPSEATKSKFFIKDIVDPAMYPASAVFEIRQNFKTPPLVNILPHSPLISMKKGSKSSDMDVYFNKAPIEFIKGLKAAKSIDLYFHGYNVRTNKSLDIRKRFAELLEVKGCKNMNALISWSGDMGNSFLSKMFYFNRSVKSASLSWEGVATTSDFIRTHNPNIKINAVTHSLGAGMLLEAANHGVKFGTVILIVPAVDNESLSPRGKYEMALKNIDQLVVVYSRNQKLVFIPYMLGRFDRALGDVGPSGPVNHPNFVAIDATKASMNPDYGLYVNGHSDIYRDKMIDMMIKYLHGVR